MRRTRKSGGEIRVEKTVQIPVYAYVGSGFYSTVEGCTLSGLDREIVNAARRAFYRLSPEERGTFLSSPEDGEFVDRALFWKRLLEPVMSPEQCHMAVGKILHWYIHIKKKRKAGQ